MKNARERMDVIAAYREVGTYRGAAAICGTTHKTVKRVVDAPRGRWRRAGASRTRGPATTTRSPTLVAERVEKTHGPDLGASGCCRRRGRRATRGRRGTSAGWSPRPEATWRRGHHRGRRPAVWSPGETLVIDWGVQGGLHVFCAVLAWSRLRFVRFAADEKASTTLALLAECFEALGGVPKVGARRPDGLPEGRGGRQRGRADRGLRPVRHPLRVPAGLLRGRRPGVEGDRGEPGRLRQGRPDGARRARRRPTWLGRATRPPRGGAPRSTPRSIRRSARSRPSGWRIERELLAALPSLRPEIGAKPITRKVDQLSCVRFGSARYSVPIRLIGTTVTVLVDDRAAAGRRAGHR